MQIRCRAGRRRNPSAPLVHLLLSFAAFFVSLSVSTAGSVPTGSLCFCFTLSLSLFPSVTNTSRRSEAENTTKQQPMTGSYIPKKRVRKSEQFRSPSDDTTTKVSFWSVKIFFKTNKTIQQLGSTKGNSFCGSFWPTHALL